MTCETVMDDYGVVLAVVRFNSGHVDVHTPDSYRRFLATFNTYREARAWVYRVLERRTRLGVAA